QMLSQSVRQVLYALLTRPPPSPEGSSRLACVKHSVSVHPEPGSNSSFNLFTQFFQLIVYTYLLFVDFFISLYSVVNVLFYCFSFLSPFLVDKDYNITINIFRQQFFLHFFKYFIFYLVNH
ncbi:hypothetical protein FVAG_03133, partial [Fusobacterium varium ATCC 27725]